MSPTPLTVIELDVELVTVIVRSPVSGSTKEVITGSSRFPLSSQEVS